MFDKENFVKECEEIDKEIAKRMLNRPKRFGIEKKKFKLFLDKPNFKPETIKKIEEHYSAKYLLDLCVKNSKDIWSENPISIFYNPIPDIEAGHSHYFGIFIRGGQTIICNAQSVADVDWYGVIDDNGIVYLSRYRHDYRETQEGYFIDGGQDYQRCNKPPFEYKIDPEKIISARQAGQTYAEI